MFRVACTGNLCFGKCGVLHCSLWAVQTHNYIYATRNVQMHLKSTAQEERDRERVVRERRGDSG